MSKVSRSVHQKLQEENKKLERDIYSLVMKFDQKTFNKWHEHFWTKELFARDMKKAAILYIENNPEYHWIKNLGIPNV